MKKTGLKIITFSLPVIVAFLLYMKNSIIKVTSIFPKCYFYEATGWLCPACGNTRSVICLLNGDITGSLRYNITPVLLIIIAVCFYIELVCYSFNIKVHIFPRNYVFLFVLLFFLISYYILRNFIPFMRIEN